MPVLADSPLQLKNYVPSPYRIRWTREDCERFERNGLLEAGRYELIEGDIVQKVKNSPHLLSFTLLFTYLVQTFGVYYVQGEGTINVLPEDFPTSNPEPDIAVSIRPLTDFVGKRKPQPHEILRIVEIADSTLAYDLTTRANLYARSGISEYWVADTDARRIFVHRMPEDGTYQKITVHTAAESVAGLAAPDKPVLVGDLLPSFPRFREPAKPTAS